MLFHDTVRVESVGGTGDLRQVASADHRDVQLLADAVERVFLGGLLEIHHDHDYRW